MAKCGVCLKFRGKAHEVLEHARNCFNPLWTKVYELKREFKFDSAARVVRQIFGIAEPMTDEAKAKLKQYRIDHKEEIAEKRKLKALVMRKHKRSTEVA